MARTNEYPDFETEIHAVVALALKAIKLAERNGELESVLTDKNDTILTLQDKIAKLEARLSA